MAWIPTLPVSARAQGIASITLAVFLLSLSDALVKLAGDRFGLAQIVLIRSLVAGGLLMAGLVAISGWVALRPHWSRWVWLRSLCLSAMWLCYYAALPSLSFALAAACYYTSPIWMALMARCVLGETVGRRGWVAIAFSTVGVILAVNPSAGNVTITLFLPIMAAIFYALAGTITWSRCQSETAQAMALNLNICLCFVAVAGLLIVSLAGVDGGGFVLSVWPDLTVSDWGLASLLGAFLAVITIAVALAYRLAPTPTVGVFDTAYLGFAALWGGLLFGNLPSPTEMTGIGMIAAGAILMSIRKVR